MAVDVEGIVADWSERAVRVENEWEGTSGCMWNALNAREVGIAGSKVIDKSYNDRQWHYVCVCVCGESGNFPRVEAASEVKRSQFEKLISETTSVCSVYLFWVRNFDLMEKPAAELSRREMFA